MKIKWYGTAAVMLESRGFRIAVDPFLGMPLKDSLLRRRLLAAHFRTAKAVLVTHGHFDHILDIPRLYRGSDTPIYATKTPCLTLYRQGVGKEQLHKIQPGDSFTIGGFTIRVYQGRHCRFDAGVILSTAFKKDTILNPKRLLDLLKINRRYQENGETLIYEIEAEGKRLQLLGSMGIYLSVPYPTGADAMILPFQGTSCPARTVAPIIGTLQPRSVYLDHYDDAFPPMSSQVRTIDFTAKLIRHGIPCEAMQYGKTYII